MIEFSVFEDLKSVKLKNFLPKPTTLSVGQEEALNELWVSEDGTSRIGIWECTEGTFTADRTKMAEYCHIISGTASIINEDNGNCRDVGPGDLLVLPIGWKGKWTIKSQVKKLYILCEAKARA